MALLPITLGVRLRPDAKGAVEGHDDHLHAMNGAPRSDEVLARDGYTCRCCGFYSPQYQRVIPWDSSTQKAEPFVTVCSFCELSFSLERTGLTGGGILIWLPEMTQAELNHIMRAIYVARAAGGALAEGAARALDVLLMRRTEAKKRLGSDDPLLLATVLVEKTTPEDYRSRGEKLDGLRLLPLDRWLVHVQGSDVDLFPKLLKYWQSSEGPFGQYRPDQWMKMFDDMTQTVQS